MRTTKGVGVAIALVMTLSGNLGFMVLATQAQVVGTMYKAAKPEMLNHDQAEKILPPSVFYRGQSAPVQGRNSSGIRLEDGRLVLAALVDTSGYSSSVAERYQGYLITEEPLQVGDKMLAPGAYGFGFVGGDRMVVMDVGANEVLNTATKKNAELKRPIPLQILADGEQYRLYLGRNYVVLALGNHGK